MNDDFEPRVRDWLRRAGAVDPADIARLAGSTASLPPRRVGRTRLLAAVAAVIVVAVVAGGAMSRLTGWPAGIWGPAATVDPAAERGATLPTEPRPGDPARFAGDPRLLACGGSDVSNVEYAFEMPHAADYRRYLPKMGMAPELDVPDPAFVVVFRHVSTMGAGGAAPPPGQTWAPRTPRPGYHDACFLVGADPATWQPNVYADIDFTGFSADPPPAAPAGPTEPPTSVPPGFPTSSPTPVPTVTRPPLPGRRAPTAPSDFPRDRLCLPVGSECSGVAVVPGDYARNRSSRPVMVEASGDVSWVVVVQPGETGLILDGWSLHTYGTHVALSVVDASCKRVMTFDPGDEGLSLLEIAASGAPRMLLAHQLPVEPLPDGPLEISDACP